LGKKIAGNPPKDPPKKSPTFYPKKRQQNIIGNPHKQQLFLTCPMKSRLINRQ